MVRSTATPCVSNHGCQAGAAPAPLRYGLSLRHTVLEPITIRQISA